MSNVAYENVAYLPQDIAGGLDRDLQSVADFPLHRVSSSPTNQPVELYWLGGIGVLEGRNLGVSKNETNESLVSCTIRLTIRPEGQAGFYTDFGLQFDAEFGRNRYVQLARMQPEELNDCLGSVEALSYAARELCRAFVTDHQANEQIAEVIELDEYREASTLEP